MEMYSKVEGAYKYVDEPLNPQNPERGQVADCLTLLVD